MIGTWYALLYDKADNFVAELPFEGLSVEHELCGIPQASIRVNYSALKKKLALQNNTVEQAIASGLRIVKIYRLLNNVQTLYFAGILTEASHMKYEGDANIQMNFRGWLAYFQKRYVTYPYVNWAWSAIAWDLIDRAQAEDYGDVGITEGSIAEMRGRDKTMDDDEVASTIIKMSKAESNDGYECEITNDKVFNAVERLGSDKPYIIFDEHNVESWQIVHTLGLNLTNRVKVLGEGMGDAQVRVQLDESDLYKNKWYLQEEKLSYTDVKEIDALQGHGYRLLEQKRDAMKIPSITVNSSGVDLALYSVGDTVKLEIEEVNQLYRIKKKSVNIDVSNGAENISLEFYV